MSKQIDEAQGNAMQTETDMDTCAMASQLDARHTYAFRYLFMCVCVCMCVYGIQIVT